MGDIIVHPKTVEEIQAKIHLDIEALKACSRAQIALLKGIEQRLSLLEAQ